MSGSGYDVIVIGLGAMGSAAVYQLAKRGARVLGLDQFTPPHGFGSSHGDTRITRLAIGEGTHYTPLALRSHEIWREIESETGDSLLFQVGGLILAEQARGDLLGKTDFFATTLKAARDHGIRHEMLTAEEIRRRFPAFNVRDDESAYYEPEAGYLRPEKCVAANLSLARKYSADIRTDEKMVSFDAHGGITVATGKDRYTANYLILTAGAWLPQWLPEPYRAAFTVERQVLFWFDIEGDSAKFQPSRFPIFIWTRGPNGFYGFPATDGAKGGVKVATEHHGIATLADTVKRDVDPEEAQAMHRDYVAGSFTGLSARCLKSVVCLYTMTPDGNFVIDRHPDFERVLIVSSCSGHGFKHSAAIGEALAQWSTEANRPPSLYPFAWPHGLAVGRMER